MNATKIPDSLKKTVVGCFECHGQDPDKHKDTFEHFGSKIHVVVTPNDCATCRAARRALSTDRCS